MKKKFFAILFALLLVLSFGLIPAVPAAAYQNSIDSSTMHFEGTLTAGEGGVFTGTIAMTAGTYYIPEGPGTSYSWTHERWETPDGEEAQGGFDIYAKEGGGAHVEGFFPCDWSIGDNHDAYSSGGPEGTWHDPDHHDWDMYSLELTPDHWYLRYTQTNESPMSGTMVWHGDGTGYAAETDPGTVNSVHGGTNTDPTEYSAGSAQEWGCHWGWGEERIPLQYLGFDVQVTDLGGDNYSVMLTPAVSPAPAVSFVFDAIGPQTAGVPFSIKITAHDGGGVVTDYTGTAELSDLTATIAPNVTDAFVDGVWTGNVTITGAMANNTITATDTVEPTITGTTDPFDVNPVSTVSFVFDTIDSQTAGVPFSITITAYDGDDVVTDYTGTAELSDLTGTIAPNVTSAFMAGVWTGDVTITGVTANNTITATDDTRIGTSNQFDVNPGTAVSIVILPDTATITAGESQAYEAYTYDEFGNEVGDVTADTDFSIEEGAGGSWVDNVYTSEVTGEWQVTGICGECTGCTCLTVNPCAAVSIVISPDEATITASDNITYTVTAYDDYGNSFDVTADTTFSINPEAGGSWDANVYTSEVAGEWQVTGTCGELTDYASLTVEPGSVETLTIVQQPTDTTAGVVIAPAVTVKALDELGNAIPDQDVIASLQVGTGTLSGNLTQVTDGSGMATFDNLSIDLAGVIKVLRFTANSVTVDSNSFTVDPAPVYDNLLTLKEGWTLISTDREIDVELSEFMGATLVLKYTESGFLEATFADLKPVEALYVKMPDGGWVGLNYLDVVPGVSAKDLVAGWNLVSSATADNAAAVLSPLRYVQVGEEQGVGLTTVVSQGSYNLSGTNFYVATLTDADWESLGMRGLNPFDGYWVYMNAAKVFGVIQE